MVEENLRPWEGRRGPERDTEASGDTEATGTGHRGPVQSSQRVSHLGSSSA